MRVARKPNERVNRKLVGQFIETVLKLFLVVFTVAAVASPPEPLLFTVVVITGWIASVPVAYALVYRNYAASLAASELYQPGTLVERRTTLWFTGTAIVVKLALLALASVASIAPGRTGGILFGVVALAAAYGLVYRGGYDRLGLVR